MQIFIKTSFGKAISLEVEPSDTIETVKVKIQETYGIPPDLQRFFFNSKELANVRSLSDCHIRRDSVIYMRIGIQIFLTTLTGVTIILDIDSQDTIENVKDKITDKVGRPNSLLIERRHIGHLLTLLKKPALEFEKAIYYDHSYSGSLPAFEQHAPRLFLKADRALVDHSYYSRTPDRQDEVRIIPFKPRHVASNIGEEEELITTLQEKTDDSSEFTLELKLEKKLFRRLENAAKVMTRDLENVYDSINPKKLLISNEDKDQLDAIFESLDMPLTRYLMMNSSDISPSFESLRTISQCVLQTYVKFKNMLTRLNVLENQLLKEGLRKAEVSRRELIEALKNVNLYLPNLPNFNLDEILNWIEKPRPDLKRKRKTETRNAKKFKQDTVSSEKISEEVRRKTSFKKRSQIYEEKTAVFLQNCLPLADKVAYLHSLEIYITHQFDQKMQLKEISEAKVFRVGLLLSKQLPIIPEFTIVNEFGIVYIKLGKPNWVQFSNSEIDMVRDYHVLLLSELLNVYESKYFDPENSPSPFYLVPAKQGYDSPFEIDWSGIFIAEYDSDALENLPEAIFRMNLLLKSVDLKQKFQVLSFNNQEQFETFHFGINRKIQKKLKIIPKVVPNFKEPATDIQKSTDENIINFYHKTKSDVHPGIVLQALTLQVSEEDFNLERMEFIGDTFLQYITTVECFVQNQQENKSQLTARRTEKVKNSFLYRVAEEKNICSYIHALPFEKNLFCPPSYIVQKGNTVTVKDKAISDVIEALIGAILISNGHNAAADLSAWLGIIKNPMNIPGYEKPTTEVTATKDCKKPRIKEFEALINYQFSDKKLVFISLMPHMNTRNENVSFDQLVYLGDALLYYLISRCLFDKFRMSGPGELTALRGKIMNGFTYTCLGIKFKFQDFIILPDSSKKKMHQNIQKLESSMEFKHFHECGFENSTSRGNIPIPRCLSEMFKSIAGAVFIDSKSLNVIWKVYYPFLKDTINNLEKIIMKQDDALTKLQIKLDGKPILWEVEEEDDVFTAKLIMPNLTDVYIGIGESKDLAKLNAAENFLNSC